MKQNAVIFFILALLLAACGGRGNSDPTPDDNSNCFGFSVDAPDNITCIESGDASAVVQANPDASAILQQEALQLEISGTVIIERTEEATRITALEGNNSITFEEETLELAQGSRIEFPIVEGVLQSPQAVEETDISDISVPEELPRNIRPSETPEPEETPEVTVEPITDTSEIDDNTPQEAVADLADGCDSAWTNVYVVQSGDVLSIIARNYGTTVEEMTINNCLLNPSRLAIEQVLRVPKAVPLTPTPNVFFFFASESTLYDGNCTLLRWDAINVQTIFLDGDEVDNTGLETVCPEETTTYTLKIMYPDGSEVERETTVEIIPRP